MRFSNDQIGERFLATLIIIAIMMICVGSLGLLLFAAPSMRVLHAVSILSVFFGIVLVGVGVFWGLWHVVNRHAGPEIREYNCRIMARYGVNEQNETVIADWVHDGDGIRTYVRVWSPTRGAQEFECAYPVWCQCGEGMLGQAITKGKWLSGFFMQAGPTA